MKSISVLLSIVVLALLLVIGSGFSEAWAKGSGGKNNATWGVTQSSGNAQINSQALSSRSNVQVNAGTSSSSTAQAKKKPGDKKPKDQQEYFKVEMRDALISSY
jgi:hypothetical protein